LSGPAKSGADQANAFIDFSAAMLSAHFGQSSTATGLMEHPEDLGVVRSGHHPGSAWHFTNIKSLLNFPGVQWGALAQSSFGTSYPKPTRLLGRLGGLDQIFFEGPPQFDPKGGYKGPLPRQPAATPMTLGRKSSGGFNTQATAAWPPRMCEKIATMIINDFILSHDKAQKTGERRGSGGESKSDDKEETKSKSESKPKEGDTAMPRAPPVAGGHVATSSSSTDVVAARDPQGGGGMVELMGGLPPPGPTTRRKILPQEVGAVRKGREIKGIFIGRPSVWGNPYKIGRDGDRVEVIQKFTKHLETSGLRRFVGELRGCELVCYCDLDEACHGDVLIRMADGEVQRKLRYRRPPKGTP